MSITGNPLRSSGTRIERPGGGADVTYLGQRCPDQVQRVGAFVRILVPVNLTGGYTVTHGAWLSVSPDDLRHAWEEWWAPTYGDLRLNGVLANMLLGWESETYAKPVEAAVLKVEQVLYAVGSTDDFMLRVLEDEWPHEFVLNAIAPYERPGK